MSQAEIQKVQILNNLSETAQKVASQAEELLGTAGFELVEGKNQPDLYITIGGDGTFLNQVRRLEYPPTPFIGINTGSLGFYPEVEVDQLSQFVTDLQNGQYQLQALPLLKVEAQNNQALAMNEMMVERASASAVHVDVEIDGQLFEKFVGDGLIVSTPQGSTAYASAAGGAIIPIGLETMQIVPSNPHDSMLYKSIRAPIVLSDKSVIKFRAQDTGRRPFRIVTDGADVKINQDSLVKVYLAKRRVNMLRTERFSYFERLAHKMINRK